MAFLPIDEDALNGLVVWDECLVPPAQQTLVLYGYGMRRAATGLVHGEFSLEASPRRGAWTALGSALRITFGDSGGPVLGPNDDEQLAVVSPRVCLTVSAMRYRTVDTALDVHARALLQPAWNLDQRLLP